MSRQAASPLRHDLGSAWRTYFGAICAFACFGASRRACLPRITGHTRCISAPEPVGACRAHLAGTTILAAQSRLGAYRGGQQGRAAREDSRPAAGSRALQKRGLQRVDCKLKPCPVQQPLSKAKQHHFRDELTTRGFTYGRLHTYVWP
jgi:hypothetical protein